MKLTINEEKTRIYDLRKERMKYLGYVFYIAKENPDRGSYSIANILSEAKEDEIVEKCKILLAEIRRNTCYKAVHDWNIYVIGIHNYYKGMAYFCKCFRKIGWRIYKIFYHTMNKKIKFTTEQSYKNDFMKGKYSSWGKKGYYSFNRYPIIEINWANWDKTLICAAKSKETISDKVSRMIKNDVVGL